MKIKILKGLPASGKSTWAKDFVSKHPNWVRVNRDDLRRMRGDYWVPKQEGLITSWTVHATVEALLSGYSVILDATNLNDDRTRSWLNEVKELFKLNGGNLDDLSTESKIFDVDLDECIRRDLQRENSVGEKVIKRMYDKHILSPDPYDPLPDKPDAFIFDVDGTLALMGERSPYDWDRVGEDTVNEPVAEIFRLLKDQGNEMIVFTGRDGCCHDETFNWLLENDLEPDVFATRGEGSTRRDSDVKRELFNKYVRNYYNVKGVFDDRNQVVDMWRKELKLPCFQVNYGDF